MKTEKHTEIHLSTDANSFEKITTDVRRKVDFFLGTSFVYVSEILCVNILYKDIKLFSFYTLVHIILKAKN